MPQLPISLWLLFLPFFVIFFITMKSMNKIAESFYTALPVRRKFSIFNLEFPGSEEALTSLIVRMNHDVREKVKKHLLVDYIFMLGVYPGIAILCFIAARSVQSDTIAGSYILNLLGILQIVAWLCNAIENQILLQKIKKPVTSKPSTYPFFKWIVGIKFFIALTAVISSVFAMIYTWLIGDFSRKITLIFSALVVAFIIFMLIKALIARHQRREKERLTTQLAKTV